MSNSRRLKIRVGDIYEDCAHHPVLCTESGADAVAGISLFDGSGPRSCSVHHCGPRKMTPHQVAERIKHRQRWLAAQAAFQEDWDPSHFDELLAAEGASDHFALLSR